MSTSDITPNAEPLPSVRIPAANRRQAMDWSLVLISQSISSKLQADSAGGHWLEVAAEDEARAEEILRLYREENRRWRWQRRIPTTPFVFHWGSLVWVALIVVLHLVAEPRTTLHEAGVMRAEAVLKGDWWRPITAVTLHGDYGHLASNAMFGFIFLGVAMGYWGVGLALLASLMAGVVGNFAGWIFYPASQSIVGASGMIMGAIGLLAVIPAPVGSLRRLTFQMLLRTLTPAVFLFVMMGFAPSSAWICHAGGFIAGVLFGLLLFPLRRRPQLRERLSKPALLVAVIIFAVAWLGLVFPTKVRVPIRSADLRSGMVEMEASSQQVGNRDQ